MQMCEPEIFIDRYKSEWQRMLDERKSHPEKFEPKRTEPERFEEEIETSKGYIVTLRGTDEGFGRWAEGSATVVSKKELEECEAEGYSPPKGRLFTFQCLHFKEGSEYGIVDNGKISKLSLSLGERGDYAFDATCLLHYDRGWDMTMEKFKNEMDAAYEAILKKFN